MPWRSVVSSSWLRARASAGSAVQVIDASWHLPATGRDARAEFARERIPGAKYFDLDECVAPSPLPHMMPHPKALGRYLAGIGLRSDLPTVVYDASDDGIFSSARLWWMLRAVGMKEVAVLAGGLKNWKANELELDTTQPSAPEPAAEEGFAVEEQPGRFISAEQVLKVVQANQAGDFSTIIIDARSAARFKGEVPEARPGVQSGHIPCSINIPYTKVLTETGMVRHANEILSFLATEAHIDLSSPPQRLIFSCGSGVTACVPLLALHHRFNIPLEHCTVYDGAWTEWGAVENNFPIAGPSSAS